MASSFGYKRLMIAFRLGISLAKDASRPEHFVNPFLNILNMTAKTVVHYPDIMSGSGVIWRCLHSVCGAGLTFFRSVLYRPYSFKIDYGGERADILIISHLTTKGHLSNKDDFYFGDIARELVLEGYRTKTILINHCRATKADAKTLARRDVILLPAFLSPSDELGLIFKLVKAACSFPSLNGTSRYSWNAKFAQFNHRAICDLRIGTLLNAVARELAPKVIVHTFEGHGWERYFTAKLHELDDAPYVIGYQHAVLFPGLKSLLYRFGKQANPDHLFTIGEVTKRELIMKSEHQSVSVLGSNRAIKAKPAQKFGAQGTCLFAPEGDMTEVRIMAELALEAARRMPYQMFVLRLHPLLDKVRVQKSLHLSRNILKNFRVSDAGLDADLSSASWLCYRGSTVALQGMQSGLRPIYFDADNSAEFNDPIPDYVHFRRRIKNVSGLVKLIKADQHDSSGVQAELDEAIEFAQNYVMPLDTNEMIARLKDIAILREG